MDRLPFKHLDGSISIPCTKCDEYLRVQSLLEHREAHRVWKIFRCSAETVPRTLKQLLKRRRQIINEAIDKADRSRPVPVKVLQKIDWAFEKIRKSISEERAGVVNEAGSSLKKKMLAKDYLVAGRSSKLASSGQSVGICHCKNERWRSIDEDRYIFKESCLGKVSHGFFGVFDGYNSEIAADKCSRYFYDILIKELGKTNNELDWNKMSEDQMERREGLVKDALRSSFHEMDNFLLTGEFESSKLRWSGTSATICYIENDTLFIANAGSVRGLFVKGDGSAVSITKDHTLESKKERDRLKKSNANISLSSKTSMINGLLASTRGLGNHGDPVLKSSVIADPSVTTMKIDPDDQFFILYSSGIWEIFDDNEVMFLLEDIMPDFSDVDVLREHLLKQELENNLNEQRDLMPNINEIANDEIANIDVDSEEDGPDLLEIGKEESNVQFELASVGTVHEDKFDCSNNLGKTLEKSIRSEILSITDTPLESTSKGKEIYKESKACFLARALVERLVYSALLAGSHENITAMVVLLHGCPTSLYLLPEVKRKSLFQKRISKIDQDRISKTAC